MPLRSFASSACRRAMTARRCVVERPRSRHRARRVPDAARPLGLGQDDDADDARRLRAADRGRDPARRHSRSSRLPPHRRDIGMVFQNYALFPHMTVAREHRLSAVGARACRATRSRSASSARSTWCSSTGFGERRPAQLSGGQQQRVALARALVFEPKLVLMDEPLGALDKQLREQMQLEIKHLHRRLGVTMVYVTHDQAEALTMSDRIAVFNAAASSSSPPRAQLYEQPRNAFVARLHRREQPLAGHRSALGDGGAARSNRRTGAVRRWPCSVGRREPGERVILSLRPERVSTSRRRRPRATVLPGERRGADLSRRSPAGAGLGRRQDRSGRRRFPISPASSP